MRKLRTLSLATLCLVALGAGPAKAKAATLLGFADDLDRTARAAPAVAGTSEVARIPVSFFGVRESGWVDVDRAVAAARASGQRLFFSVSGLYYPDLTEWRAILIQLRLRYPDLWAVQAWNEPNLDHIGGNLTVEQTVSLVQAARDALPGVTIVGPAVSPTVDGAETYQRDLYAALPDDVGVGVNIYTYRKASVVPDVVADYNQAKADGGAAPVYVTEIGFHAAAFPDQPLASAQAFEALRRQGAATVIFYRLLSNPFSPSKWEQTGNFAVVNDDLSPTPTLMALHNAMTAPVDIAAPKLKLGKVKVDREARTAKVDFSAADDVTGKRAIEFICELDKRKPVRCASPKTFKRLAYGPHRLDVTASDGTGNEQTDYVNFKVRKP